MKKFLWISFKISIVLALSTGTVRAAEVFSSHDVSSDQSNSAADYWTPERMQNAKPFPTPKRPATVQGYVAESSESSGASGSYPGYDPDKRAESVRLDNAAGPGGTLVGESNGYAYPPPQETFFVMESNYGTASTPYPYKTIGKVFFTGVAGEDSECSAASIGGRAVLTAAHCVCEEGVYYTNWIFVPAYRDGKAPFGKWTASSFMTFSSFLKKEDIGRDVAFAIVKDHDGAKLSKAVGNLGFAYGQSRIRHWSMFGYPAEEPWTGKVMVETEASYAAMGTTYTPNTTGIGTTQLGGCSGGPWIMNFAPGRHGKQDNLANGVNSYSPEKQDLWIFSSYFDSGKNGVEGLYKEAIAK